MEILYQDEYFTAVNKPNAILVHATAISRQDTVFVLQLLREQLGHRVTPVHRLDRPTSGVLVFGHTKEAVGALSKAFAQNETSKTYLAMVRGWCPESGTIDYPVPKKDEGELQEAVTHFNRIATTEIPVAVGRYNSARYSLVEVRPKTGRMHQIRRHFKHIRHGIIGDIRYGDRFHNRYFREERAQKYLFLHAYRLSFTHPYTGVNITIEAALPQHFSDIIRDFGWQDALQHYYSKEQAR